MSDKEKIINGLKWHIRTTKANECRFALVDCPYVEECKTVGTVKLFEDILALLKEQDAVEPKTGHWIYRKYDDMFMCSSCEKYSIRNDYPYCHWCGAKMEGR